MNAPNRRAVINALVKAARSRRGEVTLTALAVLLGWVLGVIGLASYSTQQAADRQLCAHEAETVASPERQIECWERYGIYVPPE